MSIKGYKAFDKDLKCLGMQFKVGKTYKETDIAICHKGFHYCENLFDVYNYYPKTEHTRICEIEDIGTKTQKENNKSCTNHIKIVRELTHLELLKVWINKSNSGNYNSGNWNSGNYNSGDWNSGYGNSGNYNSGNWNSGNYNSGNWNSGNYNSGNWNSGNWNSGIFNTSTPIYFFNKKSKFKYTKEFEIRINSLNVRPILQWIPSSQMSEDEKQNNPSHKVTGGFLRKTDQLDWSKLTESDKQFILSLPNYDDEIFKQITGISLLKKK